MPVQILKQKKHKYTQYFSAIIFVTINPQLLSDPFTERLRRLIEVKTQRFTNRQRNENTTD
ncbi:MAG: hypothetical protein LBT09_14955 [Planctomycetaceae bacterium]|nr:hypothetical protein [Planctomycetaceae bacterium]